MYSDRLGSLPLKVEANFFTVSSTSILYLIFEGLATVSIWAPLPNLSSFDQPSLYSRLAKAISPPLYNNIRSGAGVCFVH